MVNKIGLVYAFLDFSFMAIVGNRPIAENNPNAAKEYSYPTASIRTPAIYGPARQPIIMADIIMPNAKFIFLRSIIFGMRI